MFSPALQLGLLVLSIFLLQLYRRLRSPLRHLNGPPSTSWWMGNLGQIYSRNGWAFHRELVEKYGGAVKLHGLFGKTQIYLTDPKALYNVMVKDSEVYDETNWYLEGNQLVFGPGLLSTVGAHHRRQRRLLNPVFSTRNIRLLSPLFYTITKKMKQAIAGQVKDGHKEIDMLHWMSRAALEIIGQGGLGCSIDPLDLDRNSATEYGRSIKNLIPTAFRLSMFRFFIPIFVKLGPSRLRRFLLDITPSVLLQRVKEVVDVMDHTSTEIYHQKKMAIEQGDKSVLLQVGEGRDIMSRLLKANLVANSEDRLPERELIAQMSTFMFAGHDTTSSALSRALYTLAQNPEVQHRLRQEIVESGVLREDISYDELTNLPYLDAICRETLRLHPPVNFMARTARRDMVLPLDQPIKAADGVTDTYELMVPKGTDLIVGFGETNRRKSIWGEDAYEWKPERWLAPLPSSVTDAHVPGVYSSMMTFSAGPRGCIGFKYAELEMKMVLAVLIKSFVFDLPEGKELVWNLGGIQTPAVKDAEFQTPHMPMKVSPAT